MTRIRLLPYKMGSQSARDLTRALGGLQVYPDRNYKPRESDLIINWGSSEIPKWYKYDRDMNILNDPCAVARATNKLTTLEKLSENDIQTVPFTTDIRQAKHWIVDDLIVIERHKLNGSRGEGIVIVEDIDELAIVPLYTQFIKNAREYRVHVFDGKVIDVQQKKRRTLEEDDEVQDGSIKNLDHGWVFVRDNITDYPTQMLDEATKAIECLGLDFGAVDILSKNGEVYILEINTAMGLEGQTLINYTNAIKNYATTI